MGCNYARPQLQFVTYTYSLSESTSTDRLFDPNWRPPTSRLNWFLWYFSVKCMKTDKNTQDLYNWSRIHKWSSLLAKFIALFTMTWFQVCWWNYPYATVDSAIVFWHFLCMFRNLIIYKLDKKSNEDRLCPVEYNCTQCSLYTMLTCAF